MLLCQHCGRNQHRHLTTSHDGLECCAYGDLGFTEAHVSAHQSIHRLGPLHVFLGGVNRIPLVLRFLMRKGTFKFPLPGSIGFKSKTRFGIAHGLDFQQVSSQVSDRFFGLVFRGLPTFASQSVQRRPRLTSTDILADKMCFTDGDIELGRALTPAFGGIFNDQVFGPLLRSFLPGFGCHGGQSSEPLEATNTVLEMHHIISFFQI